MNEDANSTNDSFAENVPNESAAGPYIFSVKIDSSQIAI